MHRVISMCLEAAIASVVLIPVFLVLNQRCFRDRTRTVCYFIFAVYLAAVDSVVGLPDITYIRFDPHLNFVPFAYMFSDFQNSFLNVLLFMPLGFLLPVFWKNFKKFHWTVLFGFCISLLIEVLQIFTFRATDVNDLMTNTLGTFLGWFIARILLWLAPGITPGWKTKDVYIVCGVTFAVMFFVQPFLADLVWLFLYA